MSYFCGVDIGGTFTDCVVLDEAGGTTLAKVPSTPPDFYQGFIDALEAVGGYPTSTNRCQLVKQAGVRAFFRRTGRMPESLSELDGEIDWVGPKTFDRFTETDDVWVFAWSGGGGFGDPIERDPEAVLADVAAGRVTRGWAERAYGVVIAGEERSERVDAEATETRRREIVAERLSEARPWNGGSEDDELDTPLADGRLTDDLQIVGGEYRVDGVSLGPATRNYKLGALIRDLPLTEANPEVRDATLYVDADVAFRQVICPHTGRLLQTEIVVDGAAPQWDLRPGMVVDGRSATGE